MSKELARRMGTSQNRAARLINTEAAAFREQASTQAMRERGAKQLEIIATLDKFTCADCGALDGKKVDIQDAQVGVTVPTFHPNCRCTTATYDPDFDEFEEDNTRIARGADGETYHVPATMTYEEWKAGLTDVENSDTIDPKMLPNELAGCERGEPMDFDNANHGKPNPNYHADKGYRINCQSCVVSYEARLRGYDVQTLPNTEGSVLQKLSRQTNSAWVDPETGQFPAYLSDDSVTTVKRLSAFLENQVQSGERYTLQWTWKGKGYSGHIISLDRDSSGLLRFYDPQTGRIYDTAGVTTAYFNDIKFRTSLGGVNIPIPPKLLRVDNMQFNLDVVNHIMEEAQ